eukprot:COSAG06_NODE_31441_length_521_cov_1.462085_1_plen_41_part_01
MWVCPRETFNHTEDGLNKGWSWVGWARVLVPTAGFNGKHGG